MRLSKSALILFLIISISAFSQNTLKYYQISISLSEYSIEELATLGIALEHSHSHKNTLETVVNSNEFEVLQNSGFNFDIIKSDLSKFYEERNHITSFQSSSAYLFCDEETYDTITTPDDFNLGTMGGYLTYDQMLLELDSMQMNYPNLITVKTQIDTFKTEENRPIYFVKISDNPLVDESTNENKVLYTALHHSREPMSMMQMIFYMQYLLENYNSNESVNFIVNNLELYFVPCVNPDGYVYNESTNPNGGGLWRKNRTDNNDGTFGVDLNRNYGENWGQDDIGSSPSTNSDTYRGLSPFSEPETKAIKYLCENNDFKTTLNYHAYGNVLITPEILSVDSLRYIEFSENLTEYSHYTIGTDSETVGYNTNGDSDTWMYKDVTNKNKQFAFTPEIGEVSEGFWPQKTKIESICKQNVESNIRIALLSTNYITLQNKSSQISNRNDSLKIYVKSIGLEVDKPISVKLLSNNFISSSEDVINFSSINDLEFESLIFNYSVKNVVNEGQYMPFEFEITVGGYNYSKTFYRVLSTQQPIYSEKFDLNTLDWQKDLWGITQEDYYSPPNSITDSPNKNYSPNMVNTLLLSKNISLLKEDLVNAFIKFNAKWETENGFDYVQLIIDDGVEEKALCGNYTNRGVGFTGQPDGEPLYDGIQKDWIEEYIDITDYLGKVVNLKFELITDGAIEMDGFYLDNFQIFALKDKGLSIVEITPDINSLMVYPNPVNERVYFSDDLNIKSLKVINSIGQTVVSVSENLNSIDVTAFKSGIYKIIILDENDKMYVGEFIRE